MTTPASESPGSRFAGHVALVVVQLCFGLFPLWGKWAFEGFSPRAVAAWRLLSGAVVLGTVAALVHRRRAIPKPHDLLLLQICALLGIALNQVLYLEGLERSNVVNAGLIMALIPVFTFTIAVLVRQENFFWLRGLGIAVACAGTVVLFVDAGLHLAGSMLHGNLLMVGNVTCYSIYLVLSRPLLRRYPPLVVIAWVFILTIWTIPLFASGEVLVPAAASTRAWISLGLILLFPTVLAYLLNLFALARVRASTTATYIFVQPLIASAAGIGVLGEHFGGATILAGIAILCGLALVVRRA